MKTRKIILLAAIVVFAVIYAVQNVLASKSSVKTFKLEDTIDSIEINSKDNGKISLQKQGETWTVNGNPADSGRVDYIKNALLSIKTLGVSTNGSDEATNERYGLTENKIIEVSASAGGKTLRKLSIGKDTATGQQNYVRIDGSNEVYIATGSLHDRFSVKAEELIKAEEKAAEETVSEQKPVAEPESNGRPEEESRN